MVQGFSENPEDYIFLSIRIIIQSMGLLSEVAVKPVAITRKNSLFSDSVAGAKASAIIFSIVGTANANNLDPYKYLEYIFRALPNLEFTSDDTILDEFLPWSEKVQLECRMQNAKTEVKEKDDLRDETA